MRKCPSFTDEAFKGGRVTVKTFLRFLADRCRAQTITTAIRNQFPNVTVVVATSRPGATVAPLSEVGQGLSCGDGGAESRRELKLDFAQKPHHATWSIAKLE